MAIWDIKFKWGQRKGEGKHSLLDSLLWTGPELTVYSHKIQGSGPPNLANAFKVEADLYTLFTPGYLILFIF